MTAWLNGAARIKSIAVRAVVALCVVAVGLWIARPAWADATIGLELTAPVEVGGALCAGSDAIPATAFWAFEVRDASLAETGEFVAFSATFDTPAGKADVSAGTGPSTQVSPTPGTDGPTPGTDGPTTSANGPTTSTDGPATSTEGSTTSGDRTPTTSGAPTPTVAPANPEPNPKTTSGPAPSAQPALPVPRSGLDGRRAWAITPTGWRLVAASARVTGTGGHLELVGVCSAATAPAGGATVTALPAPVAATTTKRPLILGPATGATTSGPEAAPPAPHAPAAHAALPMTGTDVGGMLTLGTSLFLAGILLLVVRRQRLRAASGPDPDDDRGRAIVVTWHD